MTKDFQKLLKTQLDRVLKLSTKQKKNDTFLKKFKTINDGFGLTFASIILSMWKGNLTF